MSRDKGRSIVVTGGSCSCRCPWTRRPPAWWRRGPRTTRPGAKPTSVNEIDGWEIWQVDQPTTTITAASQPAAVSTNFNQPTPTSSKQPKAPPLSPARAGGNQTPPPGTPPAPAPAPSAARRGRRACPGAWPAAQTCFPCRLGPFGPGFGFGGIWWSLEGFEGCFREVVGLVGWLVGWSAPVREKSATATRETSCDVKTRTRQKEKKPTCL